MIYRTLLAFGALALAAITTPTFGNGVPTFVDTCGSESSYAGESILVTADIVDASRGSCIFIGHDEVTLDCQGYRMTHIGSERAGGIVVSGNQVTVKNCVLHGWQNGIIYALAEGGLILDNKLVGNSWGIGLVLSEGIWVEGNKADATTNAGIQVADSIKNTIYDNTVHGSGKAGILLNAPTGGDGADDNYVIDNQVNLNQEYGILLEGDSGGNRVFGNTANLNEGYGIALFDTSAGNVVEKNTANRNNIGIHSDGVNDFYGNRCHKNTEADSDPDGLCK